MGKRCCRIVGRKGGAIWLRRSLVGRIRQMRIFSAAGAGHYKGIEFHTPAKIVDISVSTSCGELRGRSARVRKRRVKLQMEIEMGLMQS